MDITHLLDQEKLKANFDGAGGGTDFEAELSNWIFVSYDVWSLTLTSLKSRNNQRVMANASQYFDGTSSFVFQELESGLTSYTLASRNKTLSNNTAEFSAYDFGDHADFGNSYTISNAQTNFKEVMYNYCTAQNSGIEPDTLSTPYLKHIGARTVDELNELKFNAVLRNEEDIDETQTVSYSLDATSDASGMTIDEVSGVFSWTPTESHDGSHDVIITVQDNEGRDDRERITITVNEVNAAPELSEVGDQVIDEQSQLAFTLEASDPDNANQTLTFTLDDTSIASGMSVDPSSGTFDWTPTALQVGQHEVTISVSDGLLEDSEIIAVTVNKTTDSSEEEEEDGENEEGDETILNIDNLDLATVIYPNPATGVINIEIENEYRGALEVQLLNISGKLMKHEEVFKNNRIFHLAIDLEELNPSIYFINLKTEHNNIVKKVILQ